MQADYSREKDLAIAVVVQASRLCVKIQSRLVSDLTIEKKDNSPVTVADYASQALIIAKLSSAFPEYPFIAEESGNELSSQPEVLEQVFQEVKPFLPELQDGEAGLKQLTEIIERGQTPVAGSRRWWTLDPIDGTQGFLRRGQYAVALALMEDNQPVVGVLGCPELPAKLEPEEGPKGCIMAAVKGAHAFVFTLEEAEGLARGEIVSGERLQTSQISDPSLAILTESYERRQNAQDLNVLIANELGVKVEPVRIDSQCKYAIVARGESSLYLRLSSLSYKEKIWDHAAGVLIVEEAGGRVTDFLGKSLDWSLGRTLHDSLGIVCSNGLLHDQVLAAIQKIDPVAVLSASKK